MPQKFLALEASTHRLSLALAVGSASWEQVYEQKHQHAELMLPAIHTLCAQAGMALSELDGIAYGAGPGAFTGLRIAAGVAKGLALVLGCPLLPVCSLEVLAETAGAAQVWCVMDARMNEVYAAAYLQDPCAARGWRVVSAPAVLAPALAVPPASPGPWLLVGDGPAAYPALLQEAGESVLLQPELVAPSALALLRMAQRSWHSGCDQTTAARASLFYVRDKVALTTHERAQSLPKQG